MDNEIDASNGGESLTLDQAAAAYVKATAEPVSNDQGNPEEHDESDTLADEELQADEAGEETDGEPASEDDPEQEAEQEPETSGGRFAADNANVRLSDGSIIPVSELKAGYLKGGDATRKWQEAADLRKASEAQSATLKASQQQLEQREAYVTQLLRAIIPSEPDPSLLQSDPLKYMTDKANYEAWGKHLAYLDQQSQTSLKEKADQAAKDERDKIDAEWNALTGKLTHLKDATKVDAFVADLRKAGATYGFAPDELKTVALDHRLALALNDASKWQKLQASKATVAKKVENRPPVTKGGKRASPQEQRARSVNDAMKNLQQTGRLDDAVAAYLATQQS